MFKNQLIELLSLNIIDKYNKKEEINFLLNLNQDEVKIILSNSKRASFLYNLMKKFKNEKDYDFILESALQIKDDSLLESFNRLITDTQLMHSEHYQHTILEVLKIEDSDSFKEIANIARVMIKHEDYKTELSKIVECTPLQLRLIDKMLHFYEFVNRFEFMNYIYNIKDERILTQLEHFFEPSLFNDYSREEIKMLFDSIVGTFKLNDSELILDLLTETAINLQARKEALTQLKKLSIPQMIEKSLNSRNIINIISYSTSDEIIKKLSGLPEDEDITPETIVKRMIPPRQ